MIRAFYFLFFLSIILFYSVLLIGYFKDFLDSHLSKDNLILFFLIVISLNIIFSTIISSFLTKRKLLKSYLMEKDFLKFHFFIEPLAFSITFTILFALIEFIINVPVFIYYSLFIFFFISTNLDNYIQFYKMNIELKSQPVFVFSDNNKTIIFSNEKFEKI